MFVHQTTSLTLVDWSQFNPKNWRWTLNFRLVQPPFLNFNPCGWFSTSLWPNQPPCVCWNPLSTSCIWVNNNNSLAWKLSWGCFPLLTMTIVRSQWGRSEVVIIYRDVLVGFTIRLTTVFDGLLSPLQVPQCRVPRLRASAKLSLRMWLILS